MNGVDATGVDDNDTLVLAPDHKVISRYKDLLPAFQMLLYQHHQQAIERR